MDVQTAEEVIGLGPLSVHFLITGDNSLGRVAAFELSGGRD